MSKDLAQSGKFFIHALAAAAMLLVAVPSNAFKSPEHQAVSELATANAGQVAPDIAKFKKLISDWSWGVGATGLGNPSEQLAHVEDQSRGITTVKNNGGPYDDVLGRIKDEYLGQNFSSEDLDVEGSYVLMGTALHLIEDQASPPHAANVIHSFFDHFEVLTTDVGFTGTQGIVDPSNAYLGSLRTTQDRIDALVTSGSLQYWIRSDQLRAAGDTTKSDQRYVGQFEFNSSDPTLDGVDSLFTGSYGGVNQQDVFSHADVPSLYHQQGTQAADYAFNFLLKMSKSLKPIVSGLMIGEGGGNAAPVINPIAGTQITFKVIENRTRNVNVDVIVQDKCDGNNCEHAITDGAVLKVSAAHSNDGVDVFSPIIGATAWNDNEVPLLDTNPDDLTLLPFEAEFTLNWKGLVDGSDVLSNGEHTLCVVVKDKDLNLSPGPNDGRTDTCQVFKMDNRPPIVGVLMDDVTPKFDSEVSTSADVYIVATEKTPGVTVQQITLKDSQDNVIGAPTFTGVTSATAPFLALHNGVYNATSLGTNTKLSVPVSFRVDIEQSIKLFDNGITPVPDGGISAFPTMKIKAQSGNGIQDLMLEDDNGVVADPSFDGETSVRHTFTNLRPSNYYVTATDSEDNEFTASFTLPGPQVTVSDISTMVDDNENPESGFLYQNFWGYEIVANAPSTVYPSVVGSLNVAVADPHLASVTLTGPSGPDFTVADGAASATLSAPVAAGTYVLTAVNANGVTTVAPFIVADTTAAATVTSGDCVTNGVQEAGGEITMTSSLGLDYIDFVGTNPYQVLTHRPLGGVTTAVEDFSNDFFFQPGYWIIADVDGNSLHGQIGCNTITNSAEFFVGPYLRTAFSPGDNQSKLLGMGVKVSGFNVVQPLALDLVASSPSSLASTLPPGYRLISGGPMYQMIPLIGGQGLGGDNGPPPAGAAIVNGSFNLSFPVLHTLTDAQAANANLTPIDAHGSLNLSRDLTVVAGNGTARIPGLTAAGIESYLLLAPISRSPMIAMLPDPVTVLYDGVKDPSITLTVGDATHEPLKSLLVQAAQAGLTPISEIAQLGPENYSPHAPVYITATADKKGGNLYELSPGMAPRLLPGQFVKYSSAAVTATVDRIDSYFAVFASTPPPSGVAAKAVGGINLGLDGANLLWSIAVDNNKVTLAHNDANGVTTGSTTLSDSDRAFPWSVFFDTAGSAYAVGAAFGENGADQLAIYKAAPSGSAIVSQQTFDSGFNNNNLVFDVAAPGWIVGAAQTSGPIDAQAHGDRGYSTAIWKFDPNSGLVQLTTTYTRAGLDIATGLAVDGGGNLWVAGFSYSPNPLSARPFDLFLSKYAPDGHTLLAGPFIRESYLADYDTSLLARVMISSGVVYVAAPRGRGASGTDAALVAFDAANGHVISESAWRPSDSAPVYPSALLKDLSGNPLAAGSFDYGDGTLAGLWRYGTNGALNSVKQLSAGGAEGAVFNGSSLWLAVDGSTSPYLDTAELAVAGALSDITPPRTALSTGTPSFGANPVYITSSTPLGFIATDDSLVHGDGLGVGATQTFYAVDQATASLIAASFASFTSSFTLIAEGSHTVSFYSVDLEGNAAKIRTCVADVDLSAPSVALISSGTLYAITAQDPVVHGVASGVAQVNYLIDVPNGSCHGHDDSDPGAPLGTCGNPGYAGPFALDVGTHTVYFAAVDNVGNGQKVIFSSYVVVASTGGMGSFGGYAMNPSTGPIGVPFAITGPGGFGSYNGSATEVLIGGATAPLSAWNDSQISGSIPGLSTGTYPVLVQQGTSTLSLGFFSVLLPSASSLSLSSGPIGTPFTITGAQFGPYGGGLTKVLIGGATAPLSGWNDNQISGSIPGLPAGTYPVIIQRASSDGGLMSVSPFNFGVTAASITSISPSSGPIGGSFSLSGLSFGFYAGGQTQVLFGGATVPISVWNDTNISGTVPGVSAGTYTVVVERLTSDGGLALSNTAYYQVLGVSLYAISPASGPIGIPFTLNGSGFGVYGGGNTNVLIGGTTAALSLWSDGQIAGTIPALSTGTYPVYVERISGASTVMSCVSTFTVTTLSIPPPDPASGPIGAAFTLTGSGFGVYAGGNTQVLIGGATAALSVWNDNQISGTVPGSSPVGAQPLWIERFSGTGLQTSNTVYFTVVRPAIASITPASGPIGVSFTLTGSGFGAYAGGSTQVLFNGATTSLSVWNDTQISGTVPALPVDDYDVKVERIAPDGGISLSTAINFTIVAPSAGSVTPSSGPIGASFTITGSGFGAYAGGNTVVLVGGASAPLSAWNDTQISGSVPGALASSSGPVVITVERLAGASVVTSTLSFTVELPSVATMTPSFGPDGTGVSLTGTGFGPYAGGNTSLLLNGTTVPLAVWNENNIVWTVPDGFPDGTYPLVVRLTSSDGGTVTSSSVAFTVGTGFGGQSFAVAAPLAAHPDWYFAGGMNLPSTQDNRILTPSHAAVSVSSGSLTKDTVVTVGNARALHAGDRAAALVRAGLGAAGEAISFGPEGTQFTHPVTIELPYDPNLVSPGQAATLAINYFDPLAKSWTPLDTTLDAAHHLLSAKTSHFSLYQPLGPGIGTASAAQDAFGLRTAYVFPNPVRGTSQVTIRIEPGLADSVEVRIYDVAGRKVHSSSDFSFASAIDPALGTQDIYDHVWDVSGVGSGVYTYALTAKKAGQKDIHATGRIGVIK